MNNMQLKITDLTPDARTQIRVGLASDVVDEYATAYADGEKLPDLDIFLCEKKYLIVDGFHRYAAAQKAGLDMLNCAVHSGDIKDAIRFALGANAKHGLRRSNADKLRAVEIAFREFVGHSYRAVAEMCGVSTPFVSAHAPPEAKSPPPPPPVEAPQDKGTKVKPSRTKNEDDKVTPKPEVPEPVKRVGRDGITRTVPVPAKKALKDQTHFPIPEGIVESWSYAEEAAIQVRGLKTLRQIAMLAEERKVKVWHEVNFKSLLSHLENVIEQWKLVVPYAVCPTCNGMNPEKCGGCGGRGFISEFSWENVIPEAVKKARKV